MAIVYDANGLRIKAERLAEYERNYCANLREISRMLKKSPAEWWIPSEEMSHLRWVLDWRRDDPKQLAKLSASLVQGILKDLRREYRKHQAERNNAFLKSIGPRIDAVVAKIESAGNKDGNESKMFPSWQERAARRLEARQNRECAFCGKKFTPKNSLGKTCSTRCRVALFRKP